MLINIQHHLYRLRREKERASLVVCIDYFGVNINIEYANVMSLKKGLETDGHNHELV